MYIKPPKMKEINSKEKHWRGVSLFAGCGGSSTGHKMAGVNILLANEFVDIARETYEVNHPDTKVIGSDIRRIDPAKILKFLKLKRGELDLLDGSPPCFTENVRVTTRLGLKSISDVEIGDEVWTHKNRWKKVTNKNVREYDKGLYQLGSGATQFFEATEYATNKHPFLVRRKDNVEWIRMEDIKLGDQVAVPSHIPTDDFLVQDENRDYVNFNQKLWDTSNTKPVHECNGWLWFTVTSLNLVYFPTTVYNIAVEEDESYIANGLVVHNCKGFSVAGSLEKGWGKDVKYSEGIKQQVDDLFGEYVRMLEHLQPKVFCAENVVGLTKGVSKGMFKETMEAFRQAGYVVRSPILNSAWLGVPQSRERIMFMGVRNDVAKVLGYEENDPNAVPQVHPLGTMCMLVDALPHITHCKATIRGVLEYVPSSNMPIRCINASDALRYESAHFGSGGFVEDNKGNRRKLTIEELKVVSGMPEDFKLLGTFEQQWERLGRICVPQMTEAVSKAFIEHVLKPYAKARKKKIGSIFK